MATRRDACAIKYANIEALSRLPCRAVVNFTPSALLLNLSTLIRFARSFVRPADFLTFKPASPVGATSITVLDQESSLPYLVPPLKDGARALKCFRGYSDWGGFCAPHYEFVSESSRGATLRDTFVAFGISDWQWSTSTRSRSPAKGKQPCYL